MGSDEEDGLFDSLGIVVVSVLAPELQLTASVTPHLYKLLAHHRVLVYGNVGHGPEFGDGFNAGESISSAM